MADDYEARIANINTHLARRVGEMLVAGNGQDIEEPQETLLDLAPLVAREVVEAYAAKQAKFGTTPFDPDGNVLRLYPGGITIWSGFPGSGKTTLLRQLVCHILKRGSSCFLATLEEDPRDALVRLSMTAAGKPEHSSDNLAWFLDAYSERFRLWGVIGITRHLKLLAVIQSLAKQGIRHAIIDSLMCLDVANDDFEGQRKFATLLSTVARSSNIHIHIVAHPRKLVSADQELDMNDVAGARELGGMADNVVFIRRAKGESLSPTAEVTPMIVSIKKQRHFTGYLGNVNGFLNRRFKQFTAHEWAEAPTWYLPEEAR